MIFERFIIGFSNSYHSWKNSYYLPDSKNLNSPYYLNILPQISIILINTY